MVRQEETPAGQKQEESQGMTESSYFISQIQASDNEKEAEAQIEGILNLDL
jgi:hypothetical protein